MPWRLSGRESRTRLKSILTIQTGARIQRVQIKTWLLRLAPTDLCRRGTTHNESRKLSDDTWHLCRVFDIDKISRSTIPRFNVNRSTVSELNLCKAKPLK